MTTRAAATRIGAFPLAALVRGYDQPIRTVVVGAEALTSVDSTAEAMLRDLLDQLGQRGVGLWLARPKKPLRDFLERTGLLNAIGRDHLYPRVSDAVDAYSAEDADPGPSR